MSPAVAPAPSIRWRSESKEIGGFYTFLKSEVDKIKAAEGRMRTHAMKQCNVLLKEYVSFNPYIQRLYFEHQKIRKHGDSRYPQAYRYSTMPPRSPSVWDSSPMAAGRKEHSISRQSISASSQHSESTGYQSSEQTSARIMAKTPKPERGRNKSPEGAQHRSDSRNPEREGGTRRSPELIRYKSPDSNPERPRQGSPSSVSEGSPYKYRKGNQTADRNSYSHRAQFGKTDSSTRHLQEARPSEIIAEVARHVVRPLEGSGLHNSAISEGNRCRTAPESMTKSLTSLDSSRYITRQSRTDSFPESGRYRASLQRALEGSHGCLPRSGEGSQGRMLEGLQDGFARMFEGSQTASMARTFEGSQGGRTFEGQQHASLSSTFGEDGRAEILGNESKTSSSGRWSQETSKLFQGANTSSGSYQSMRQPLLQDVGGFQDDAQPAFNPRLIQGDPPPHRSDPIESSSSSSQATPPQRAQAAQAQAQDSSHQSSRHASPTKLPAGGIYTYKVPAGGSYRMPDLAQKLPEAKLTAEGNVYMIADANQYRTSESRSLEHVQVGHLLHGSHSRMPEQERSRTRTPESMLRQKRRKKITPHKCDLKELVPEQRRMKRKFIQNKVPETKKYTFYKYYGFAGQGAKTSWAHNRPLGMTPHAQRGAPQLEPQILQH